MKKIIAIASMVAVAASVAFAAEASVTVKNKINAVSLDNETGDVSAMTPGREDATALEFTFDGERVGAYWKAHINGADGDADRGGNIHLDSGNVWFKPIDILKVSVGGNGTGLNAGYGESILTTRNDTGVQLDVSVDALTFTAGIGSDWNVAFANASNQNADNGGAWAKVAYGIDGVGTVSVLGVYNGNVKWLSEKMDSGLYANDSDGDDDNDKMSATGYTFPTLDTDELDSLEVDLKSPLIGFGAGFAGSLPDVGVSYFLDAAGYLYRKGANPDNRNSIAFRMVGIGADAQYSANGLTAEVYVPVFIITNSAFTDYLDSVDGNGTPVMVGTGLKVSYDLGGVTPYAEMRTIDWLAKDYLKIFAAAGVGGTFAGNLSWNVAFEADIIPNDPRKNDSGDDYKPFSFAIPLTFSVSF